MIFKIKHNIKVKCKAELDRASKLNQNHRSKKQKAAELEENKIKANTVAERAVTTMMEYASFYVVFMSAIGILSIDEIEELITVNVILGTIIGSILGLPIAYLLLKSTEVDLHIPGRGLTLFILLFIVAVIMVWIGCNSTAIINV
jgi:hypothetical protein